MELALGRVETPVGDVVAAWRGDTLVALEFAAQREQMVRWLKRRFGTTLTLVEGGKDPAGILKRLRAYFRGDIGALDDLKVDGGGTEFQRKVWRALRRIPTGKTTSYAALAARIGKPSAVRAVAHANAVNPISVVVPCHRVIGSDGSLRGYGGGLDRKRWLLEHEGATPKRA
jgi:methylated-DNA-[protein]-cysteine S-methyltransferase